MESGMKLLKLVIVDDEPILLEGLVKTYDWAAMGFEVVGSAGSGEQAIEVIREKCPHVVLTDIRMKRISGLMVMETIEKEGIDCLFVVLSAYRDFEYAKQACDLGAYAYLLKPIEDEKLMETMRGARELCMEQLQNEEKYENWERLLMKGADSFLQVVLQKHIQNRLSVKQVEEILAALGTQPEPDDKFMTAEADMDLTYQITNSQDYEATRLAMLQSLEKHIGEEFSYWRLENEEGICVFLIQTKDSASAKRMKHMVELVKEEKYPIDAAISKPYKGIAGIRKSYEEAQSLFEQSRKETSGVFSMSGERQEVSGGSYGEKGEDRIVNAVRRNDEEELREAFVQFIYGLPKEEEQQCQLIHKVMLKTELMLNDSHGMTEDQKEQFQKYYSNLEKLNATKAVDVSYKILSSIIEKRRKEASGSDVKYLKDYMFEAVAYIEEHLNDEQLSIVSVAGHVYLNPVYFGRAFKNTFHMTFKRYLMKSRMERAKKLLEEGKTSIGTICEQVGISNPSYFSHLFKEYTGKLPSEYKKEYEI